MTANIPERILVHGPRLDDLTDFLYFDKIVYPTTMAMIRPQGMPPGYAGYPVKESLSEETQERLRKADLILPPGMLFLEPSMDQLVSALLQGADGLTKWMEQSSADVAKEVSETAFATLHLPTDRAEHGAAIRSWLEEIDSKTRRLADFALRRGKRTVAKYYADDVSSTLRPGRHAVLSVVFAQFPKIDATRVDLGDLIGFLSDEETKKKRRRLFDWQNGIETAVEKGDMRIQDVPDRIATLLDDYTTWIKASGLASKMSIAETLLSLGEAIIEGLTVVGIPKAIKTILELGKKQVDLRKEELEAPGREVAYIAHAHRSFGVE